jgi:hypothetical protein
MNVIQLKQKAASLKAQRELHIQCQTFNELSGPLATTLPISLATPPSEYTRATKRLTQESLALAHQTNATVTQLTSVIAGQSAEIAQLRQAVIVLARSAKNVEDGLQPIANGIDQVIANTKVKIRPFSDIKAEITKAWRDILDDSTFINDGQIVVTTGRVLRNVFSFGTGVPEAVRTAKREVYTHVKLVRNQRDRIEKLYEYALINHEAELAEWMKFPHTKLTANKQSWSMTETFNPNFIDTYMRTLCKMRALPFN